MTTYTIDSPFDFQLLEQGKSKRFSDLTYTTSEIDKAMQYLYDYIKSQPSAKPAMEILSATGDFLYATTQESVFVEMRLESHSEDDLKQILENMADELTAAEKKLTTFKHDSDDYKFLLSVINYCKKTIRLQLEEMKTNNDVIYQKYYMGSGLNKILMGDGHAATIAD